MAEERPVRKRPAAKSAARSSGKPAASSTDGSARSPAGSASSDDRSGQERSRRLRPRQLAEQAASQLLELTGKQPEGVTGLHRTDDGWVVVVEVLELHRVPETTDVLASYEVEVDDDGELLGYRRRERFVRGSTEGGP
ncbi:gas vesicle protein [Nocardioides sp. IC4_145]|uniref:gas vesicle protein GvpO n=1 Tax=Nocardioides sp. IC4_145 TaxID=2714037 RepID=UPI00140A116D|nr:gas vesicle protein GvpO [Nocardioides sp. IC4_145]NHC21638.1 gas vesicle protein [Nocardioides sp. IC4_145]